MISRGTGLNNTRLSALVTGIASTATTAVPASRREVRSQLGGAMAYISTGPSANRALPRTIVP